MENKKIMLLSANFGGNIGDLFIFEAVVNFLTTALDSPEIDIYPYPLRNDNFISLSEVNKLNANITIKDPIYSIRKSVDHKMRQSAILENLITTNYFNFFTSPLKKIHNNDIQYDYIVSIGGEMDVPYSILDIHSYLQSLKKPVDNIIYGPISLKFKQQHHKFLKKRFSEVKEVAIRDPLTFKKLKEIGINNIKLIPDCAFLAYSPVNFNTQLIWKGAVGLCLHSRWAQKNSCEEYIKNIAQAAKEIDSQLILFVTNIREDHLLVSQLMEISKKNDNITLELPTSTAELKYLYAKLDLVISDRLHGILIGMLNGCNILPLATRDKVIGYCEYLELDNFLLGNESRKDLTKKIAKSKNTHLNTKEKLFKFIQKSYKKTSNYYINRIQ